MPYFRVNRKLRALFLRELRVPTFGPGKLVSGCMLLNRIFHIVFEFGPVALSPCLYGGHIQGYLHVPHLVFDPAQGLIQRFTPRYRFADVMPNASAIFRMETPENRQVVFRVVSNLVRMFEYRSCRFSAFGQVSCFSSACGLAISMMLVGIATRVFPPALRRAGSRVPSPISYHTFVSAISFAILR